MEFQRNSCKKQTVIAIRNGQARGVARSVVGDPIHRKLQTALTPWFNTPTKTCLILVAKYVTRSVEQRGGETNITHAR